MHSVLRYPTTRLATTLVVAALVGMAILFAVGRLLTRDDRGEGPLLLVDGAAVSITPTPDGSFLWLDIEGTVHDATGAVIGEVATGTVGQRGLTGVAVDEGGRLFVAYTDVENVLVVTELAEDGERLVWRGPATVQGGNGGRMIHTDGRLIVGVGLLNDRDGQADPTSIVGKMIALDPFGQPEQEPVILSGPWNNPFAFDVSPAGELWVADNHPRDGDERLARGDVGFDPVPSLVLPPDSAPTGLVALDDEFYVCSYNDQTLDRYRRADDGAVVFEETVARNCRLDVARLDDGTIVYSSGAAVFALP